MANRIDGLDHPSARTKIIKRASDEREPNPWTAPNPEPNPNLERFPVGPPFGEPGPGESRFDWWERELAKRSVLALAGWQAEKFFWNWLQGKKPRGRPLHQDVTDALKLRAAGKTWPQIYAALGKTTSAAQHTFRQAVRQRKLREKAS